MVSNILSGRSDASEGILARLADRLAVTADELRTVLDEQRGKYLRGKIGELGKRTDELADGQTSGRAGERSDERADGLADGQADGQTEQSSD